MAMPHFLSKAANTTTHESRQAPVPLDNASGANSVSLIASSSAGPALAPAQGKADSEALTSNVGAPAAPAAAAPAAAPAAIVSASARDEGPAPKRLCRRHDGPMVPHAMPWGRVIDGRPPFVIARTYWQGEVKAVTVTCKLHRADGQRCNKSLSLGAHFTEEEATRRLKEWCVAGMALNDEPGARRSHMNPTFYNVRAKPLSEVRSEAELDALAAS